MRTTRIRSPAIKLSDEISLTGESDILILGSVTALPLHQRIGPAVRHFRSAAGLSQAELGRRIGKSQPWIAHVEKGDQDVNLGTVEALAEALCVSPVDLLSFTPRRA